jgi:hypothetical protein
MNFQIHMDVKVKSNNLSDFPENTVCATYVGTVGYLQK